jgi:transposase-like protein
MSDSESGSDVSGATGDETVCPVCDSANTEEIAGGDLDYRCLDCGAEFDPTGGRVNVE